MSGYNWGKKKKKQQKLIYPISNCLLCTNMYHMLKESDKVRSVGHVMHSWIIYMYKTNSESCSFHGNEWMALLLEQPKYLHVYSIPFPDVLHLGHRIA